MNQVRRESRGFVFLAVLGVMAVVLLIGFALSSSTQASYRQTGQGAFGVQEQVMARSAADYALSLIARKQAAADGSALPFKFVADQRTKSALEGTVAVTPAAPGHPVYRLKSLAPRAGDVVVHVVSETLIKRYGRGERYFLANTSGGRGRPIDVTAACQGKLAK